MIREDIKYVEDNIGIPTETSYNVQKHNLYTKLLLMAFKNRKFEEVKSYIYELSLLRKFIG